ncbi:UNVERIFIED_CONTAM: hypothetical protein K2H54_073725 [Gekko kuhli]
MCRAQPQARLEKIKQAKLALQEQDRRKMAEEAECLKGLMEPLAVHQQLLPDFFSWHLSTQMWSAASLEASPSNVKVVEVTPPVILREVAQGVWKSRFRVILKGQSARYGDVTSTADVETAVQVQLRHSIAEGVVFRIAQDKTNITKVESKFDRGNAPAPMTNALDLLVQVMLMDMVRMSDMVASRHCKEQQAKVKRVNGLLYFAPQVARVHPEVIRTINAECLSSLKDLVPLGSGDDRIHFLPVGPATFTGDAFVFPYATMLQREDGNRTMLVGNPPFLPPGPATRVAVAVSSSVPSALLLVANPRNLSAMVWGDGVLSAEERSQIPEAPKGGVLKAKFIEVRGPWVSYTASPANTRMVLVTKVCAKSEGKPNRDLVTLKLEARLKTTFEVSGSKLIAKLSLDSAKDLSVSSPAAKTPVDRYRQWSEAVVRKTVEELNRTYQERALTLSTVKYMRRPAVTVSQGLLHIQETARSREPASRSDEHSA